MWPKRDHQEQKDKFKQEVTEGNPPVSSSVAPLSPCPIRFVISGAPGLGST